MRHIAISHHEHGSWADFDGGTRYLVPLGRLCFAAIFILAAAGHFDRRMIDYAASQGVPAPHLLVPLAGILALLGGLSVALGFYARIGALMLIVFLVPVTLSMHRFWDVSDPHQAMIQRIMFLKNVAMLGGAFLIAHFGAGPLSFDASRRS
jgi:putative oxidoreductase